jgi:simple sugar transport system permease protein
VLGDIPFIGEALFQHIPLVYLAFLLVPLAHFVLFRTSWGLSLRSVGEHPRAADTVGINVLRTRYMCVLISGALAGLGGAFLSIGQLQTFLENMTAGRGFIALAALIFGKWMPARTMAACLLFGGAQAAIVRIPALNYSVSPQLLSMFPYLLTLLAFIGLVGKTTPPAAIGTPYVKE